MSRHSKIELGSSDSNNYAAFSSTQQLKAQRLDQAKFGACADPTVHSGQNMKDFKRIIYATYKS